jgi:hypothetical protein
LPIYGYVKLVCGKDRSYLVKHNGHRFIVFDIDAEFKKEQTFMIEAKPLFGFIKFSRASHVKITSDDKNVKLDDGERKISCQTTKDLYPTIDDNSNSPKFEISPSVKEALGIAKSHTLASNEKVMRPWTSFVHIRKIQDKYWIIGTRQEVTYFKGFKETLPEISLEPETISALFDLKQFTYSSVERYDYFELPGTLYGFIKPETKCSEQVDKVLQNFKSDNSFEVKKSNIVDFCEMVNAVNDTAVPPEVKFEGKEKAAIKLSFDSVDDNIKAEESVSVAKKTFQFDECFFQPKNMLTVLKGTKAETIKVSSAHRNFIITTDEEDYIGAIMELAKL